MHFTLVVALPSAARGGIGAALATALAPFDIEREVAEYPDYEAAAPSGTAWVEAARHRGEVPDRDDLTWAEVAETVNRVRGYEPGGDNHLYVDDEGRAYFLSTYNRDGKWDGYRIGGRWSAHFLHRPEAAGDPRLITTEYGDSGEEGQAAALRCDGGPRALLDFDALREHEGREAGERHDRWTALVEGLPAAEPWDFFLARHRADGSGYPLDRAQQDYDAQPRRRAALGSEEFGGWPGEFATSREQYVAQARDAAVPGDALLRSDGTWLEPGRGVENGRAAYLRAANAYLDGLAGDVVVVAVHCHG
ncbi:hypothetical protein RMN57_07095 [Kitasatospora sp. CM 4170]|uniref:Uncharacterized protein n=1 Tax=Kitasatospora aburaviensis TaxID=67265 RepID=A0ABW1EQR5_9ACTN|nr:hypothetical protein [Kitasatospora sp. CM 4170]WNM44492.1 hypothetical protein RMN57_07095 [Kitasatospora sp. CM 4170]